MTSTRQLETEIKSLEGTINARTTELHELQRGLSSRRKIMEVVEIVRFDLVARKLLINLLTEIDKKSVLSSSQEETQPPKSPKDTQSNTESPKSQKEPINEKRMDNLIQPTDDDSVGSIYSQESWEDVPELD